MPRLYSPTNRIKFTDIPDKFGMRRDLRAELSQFHSAVVTYAVNHYRDSRKFRERIVDALNIFTYCLIENEIVDTNIQILSSHLFEHLPDVDITIVESKIDSYFLTPESIVWDIAPVELIDDVVEDEHAVPNIVKVISSKIESTEQLGDVNARNSKPISSSNFSKSMSASIQNKPLKSFRAQQRQRVQKSTSYRKPAIAAKREFKKSDLYLEPPTFPKLDVTRPWLTGVDSQYGGTYTIYTTLPDIPRCQNEISVSTDPTMMTDAEYLNLFPPEVIRTRKDIFYERYPRLEYDDDLGCIIPVEGFTTEQVRENILKYPHIYRLRKFLPEYNTSPILVRTEDCMRPFFQTIEINGKLELTSDIWDTLPESKIIPRHVEFVKEYVIRRYLLERDAGMKHNFDIVGGLEPFLVLFMPPEKYAEKGYKDAVAVAKQCVISRVHFKQSRNPIINGKRSAGDCPFAGYCIRPGDCSTACQTFAPLDILLDKNDLPISNPVFRIDDDDITNCCNILNAAKANALKGAASIVFSYSNDSSTTSVDKLLYTAICQYWKGGANLNVYRLNFNSYIHLFQETWSSTAVLQKDQLSDIDKCIASAKILIISNLDFINFKDFQSATLLRILDERRLSKQVKLGITIIVTPATNKLIGEGQMFARMTAMFMSGKVGEIH